MKTLYAVWLVCNLASAMVANLPAWRYALVLALVAVGYIAFVRAEEIRKTRFWQWRMRNPFYRTLRASESADTAPTPSGDGTLSTESRS